MKKEEKRKLDKNKEEKILFLYFCTQKVKKKKRQVKTKKRKSAEKRKSHMPELYTMIIIRITFRMAPPLFHSFLQKGIYQSGKLDTILFYFE